MSDNNQQQQQQPSNKIFYIADDEELEEENLHNMLYYEDLFWEECEKDVDGKIDEFREYLRGYIDNYEEEKKYTIDDIKKLGQLAILSLIILFSDEKLKEFRQQKQELQEQNRKLDESQIDAAVLRFKKLYERRAIKL
ncbi:hypothetical protein DERP_004237 [Dermatophagoides pteronyssinus]|uniref:Uncharacterized protein n=1 Tax=Dermatophagoides pteronyssinus TaxID=6956 RepID=A0ABQ8J8I9_DERPT|nr:hypothetical protein DERP_004237 [Dermatophagoides pteronyssinus]